MTRGRSAVRPAGTKYGVQLRRRNAGKKDIQRKARGILSRLFFSLEDAVMTLDDFTVQKSRGIDPVTFLCHWL